MSPGTDKEATTTEPFTPSRWAVLVGAIVFGGAALFSVLRMIAAILGGSRLQYNDYWEAVEGMITADGSFNIAGLLEFSNNHFIAFAQLIYWANLKLFSGSNIALGLIDVLIVLCTLGILALMLRLLAFDKLLQVSIFGLAVTLLFNLSGAWNFIYAMSGAAWLSANLLVITAIYLRGRDRLLAAGACAVIATMSYGTGIFAWPAIIAVGLLRRDIPQWWKEWPYAVCMIASAMLVISLSRSDGDSSTTDLLLVANLAASFLGNSLGVQGVPGQTLGWLALLGTPACAAWMILRLRPTQGAQWVALALYSWGALLVITQGRGLGMATFGYQARYYSIAALAWLGLTVMLIMTLQHYRNRNGDRGHPAAGARLKATAHCVLPYALILPLVAASLTASEAGIHERNAQLADQQMKEIALRLEVVDGSVGYLLGGYTSKTKTFDSTARLKALGHYPFVDDWRMDCGLMGQSLGRYSGLRRGGRLLRTVQEKKLDAVNRVIGILPDQELIQGAIRCIVITGPDNVVVGIGTPRYGLDDDQRVRFHALAYRINGKYKAYLFDDDEKPILITRRDLTRARAR